VKRITLLLVVLATAGLLSACLPTAPAPTTTYDKGFDACAAPSTTAMNAWKTSSPYKVVGVYIGGANRACAQPNLTTTWLNTQWSKGWRLLPIWVGPQAPCTSLHTTIFSSDQLGSFFDGIAQASAAADAADALGLGWLSPIYYDLEGYPKGGTCTTAVQNFMQGWVRQLNARGYRAGMYSSLCSGIVDVAATYSDTSKVTLNAIWIAAWNNTPNIYGFGSTCPLSDTRWSDHQRVHQYQGGHNETYGGVTINIDTNAVDGPTG
jgi:hypothetical protein